MCRMPLIEQERLRSCSRDDMVHRPVMFAQAMEGLRIMEDGVYLDGTYGRGGHARGILQRLRASGRLLVMDKDPQAIAAARSAFQDDARVSIYHGSFAELAQWPATANGLDGVLFDLGVSSPQLDEAERGFGFQREGPLDMRMDPTAGESVSAWLARAREQEIADVLWRFGEERKSCRIAHAIVTRRQLAPLTTTRELAELVIEAIGRGEPGKHPATRTFQALRIFINHELDDLAAGLEAAHARLKPGGRLVTISFHSLEDRIVKHFISAHTRPPATNRRRPGIGPFWPTLKETGHAQHPADAEIASNPRARSAVLRVAEKRP